MMKKKKRRYQTKWSHLGENAMGTASHRDHIGKTQPGRPAQQLRSHQGLRPTKRGRRILSGNRVRRQALRVMRDDLF